ncbi:hypothetical protein FK538_00370 [Acinetobacter indicus]|uniref:hypothetical protein n=1 Tax=Acinetobacter indicus TaxID=756892 RepID=UPI0014401208|nr:hypothetical protein [Acinetobacter indicus]QIZ60561.1 hypothetical protein FK538_00370 [Acinetobacter indicus]
MNYFSEKDFFILFLLLFVKFFLIYLVLFFNLGEGFFLTKGDAEAYHLYAIGYLYDREETNFWFWFLRRLNDLGFYDREIVLIFLLFINTIIIPYLFFKIIHNNISYNSNYLFLFILSIIIFFPSIIYHSFDIYRDIAMLCIFMFSLYQVSKFKSYISIKSVFIILLIVWLYWFRDYLGFAFFLTFLSFRFINLSDSNLYKFFAFYFILLTIFNYLGLFEPLINYRNWFLEDDSSTNLKIDFNNKNLFLFSFFKSAFLQLFGFYYFGLISIILFFIESLVFIICLFYVIKNRNFYSPFLNFCLIFFVFYTTIWLISNDNFGTAIRLRWFSYFPVYIMAYIIYQLKRNKLS